MILSSIVLIAKLSFAAPAVDGYAAPVQPVATASAVLEVDSVKRSLTGNGVRIDSPYFSARWRDSVANYQGRMLMYHEESLDYDLGFGLSFLPYIGSYYANHGSQGLTFAAERLGAVAIGGFGTYRFVTSSTIRPLDIGLAVLGIGAYIYLKVTEIQDVQHEISETNEMLVEKYQIATEDITPGSIRYPTRQYPEWVTGRRSPAREPRNAREAIEVAIPAKQNGLQISYQWMF